LGSDICRFFLTGRVEVLEATVNSLEAQLEEQSSDADNAISQWQESVSTLEAQNLELESQSRRRVTEIESTVKELEVQLEEQSNGFDSAILQWEESYGALEDRNLKLEKEVEKIMKNGELARGAEAQVEAATETQEIPALADLQLQISEYVSQIKDLETKLVSTDAAQLQERIDALEGDLTSMTEQREELASSLKIRTSELNDQKVSYTEILSEKEAAKGQLGDRSANGAIPQGSVVAEMASLKSQLDEERETNTSTQSQLLAIRKELEDFAVESEETVDLWKGEFSLLSRFL
jgi:chromosome segregation ATPase